MSESVTYDGVAVTTVRRDSIQIVESAHLGDVGMGSCLIDDATGALTLVGFKPVVVTQDAAPSGNRRMASARAGARRFRRGEFPVGAGREIEVELLDGNVILGDHVIWDTDGNRPAETVSARLTWLLASAYVDFADLGFVTYPTKTMDANDYRTQTPGDVLFDCANAVGCNHFIYYDETAAGFGLFFLNSNTSSLYSTTTKISNVAGDADGTSVLSPLMDAELTRDPSKVASGVDVPYATGSTYRTLASTGVTFTPRDMVATTSSVKTLASAQALGDRLLADNATEDDSITCTVWVEPANVNDIRAGHLLQARFSHYGPEGYGSYSYFRVLKRTVTQPQNTDFRYQLDLELSPAAPTFPTSSGAVLDRAFISGASAQSVGTFLMSFSGTGDTPPGGYSAQPKSGLVDYDAGGVISPGIATGIKFLGAGSDIAFTISTQSNFVFDFGSPGGTTFQMLAKIGSTVVGSSSILTDTGTGLHSYGAALSISASGITVAINDILEIYYVIGVTAPHSGSVPSSGTFAPPYQLVVTGTLA